MDILFGIAIFIIICLLLDVTIRLKGIPQGLAVMAAAMDRTDEVIRDTYKYGEQ